MDENGPDRYCPQCGWFPENYDEEEAAPINCACPSCGIGAMKPISKEKP
jgi:rubredoxin